MSDQFDYDVVVIGGGPAGYPAAIRAAQNGLKAACIDAWRNRDGSSAFGGTCLNAGCIPSKALLESSELWHRAQHEFAVHGIKAAGLEPGSGGHAEAARHDRQRPDQWYCRAPQGRGRHRHVRPAASCSPGAWSKSAGTDGKVSQLRARHVVLASGSVPTALKSLPFDGQQIIDSWGALELDAVPPRLCVIGAGVIGLELGSVWRRLGCGGGHARGPRHAAADGRRAAGERSGQALQETGARHPSGRQGERGARPVRTA